MSAPGAVALGGLKVHVEKHFITSDQPDNGAIANFYALDAAKQSNSVHNLVVPVGSQQSAMVHLKPGRYLVEVMMPSGDILSQEASAVEGKWPEVRLVAEESAHEWHGWQHLMGNVESRADYQGYTFARSSFIRAYEISNPVPELQGDSPVAKRAWNLLAKLMTKSAQLPDVLSMLTHMPPVPLFTMDSDGETHNFGFRVKGFHAMHALPHWYALFAGPSAMELVSVPVPWFNITTGAEVSAELLVRGQEIGVSGPESGLNVTFSLLDPSMGAALGYMARGALQSAVKFVDPEFAQSMLYDKWLNPLGAAAGGYMLLGTDRSNKTQPWHQWIQNLMNNFPWLPDGAIQCGWFWLSREPSPENRAKARQALVTAYNRGLPYYSVGLQWLLDGLTLLGDDDTEAAAMARSVQKIAWRVNTSQPFNSLRLGG